MRVIIIVARWQRNQRSYIRCVVLVMFVPHCIVWYWITITYVTYGASNISMPTLTYSFSIHSWCQLLAEAGARINAWHISIRKSCQINIIFRTILTNIDSNPFPKFSAIINNYVGNVACVQAKNAALTSKFELLETTIQRSDNTRTA